MAKFVIGQPITTDKAEVTVDAGLAVGSHRFRLQVVDDAGNTSRPDEVLVSIRRLVVPVEPVTPVVTPVVSGPVGPVIGTGPIIRGR